VDDAGLLQIPRESIHTHYPSEDHFYLWPLLLTR